MAQQQISFKDAVKQALTVNYCKFTGRTSVMGFWWFVLFNVIISIVIGALLWVNEGLFIYLNYAVSLLLLLPSLGIEIRRLHDIGKSGWWLLLAFIPLIGVIILLIWFCKPSQPGENQYGPEPYE